MLPSDSYELDFGPGADMIQKFASVIVLPFHTRESSGEPLARQ